LRAQQTAFGVEVEELAGRVEGHGVVWALEVVEIQARTAAAATGLAEGDIIVAVTRFADNRSFSVDQQQMMDMLDQATYPDAYTISVLRTAQGAVEQLSFQASVPFIFDRGNFRSPDRDRFSLIYAGEFDLMMRLSADTPERRRGLAANLTQSMLIYHNVFSRLCDVPSFGEYIELSEREVKEYSDPALDDLYGYEGPEFIWRIRAEYFSSYSRARSGLGIFDVLMGGQQLLTVGNDMAAIIRLNGCTSPDLRIFERNLEIMFQRTNQI
jgi:hypothetical protein